MNDHNVIIVHRLTADNQSDSKSQSDFNRLNVSCQNFSSHQLQSE